MINEMTKNTNTIENEFADPAYCARYAREIRELEEERNDSRYLDYGYRPYWEDIEIAKNYANNAGYGTEDTGEWY